MKSFISIQIFLTLTLLSVLLACSINEPLEIDNPAAMEIDTYSRSMNYNPHDHLNTQNINDLPSKRTERMTEQSVKTAQGKVHKSTKKYYHLKSNFSDIAILRPAKGVPKTIKYSAPQPLR